MWRRVVGVTAGALFDEVMRLFAGKTRNRMVTVTVGVGVEVLLYGVVGQVGQVVANLVSNALHAVPVGGRVRLGCEGGAGWGGSGGGG